MCELQDAWEGGWMILNDFHYSWFSPLHLNLEPNRLGVLVFLSTSIFLITFAFTSEYNILFWQNNSRSQILSLGCLQRFWEQNSLQLSSVSGYKVWFHVCGLKCIEFIKFIDSWCRDSCLSLGCFFLIYEDAVRDVFYVVALVRHTDLTTHISCSEWTAIIWIPPRREIPP